MQHCPEKLDDDQVHPSNFWIQVNAPRSRPAQND
eukprot:gene8606-6632_t